MADLHITNGDSAANIIKESPVAGDVLPWRDPMHHGPFPADIDLDELSAVRAEYLSEPNAERGDTALGFRLRDDHLRAAEKYDRIVLWFEHDLLDQLQILQLLDWFRSNKPDSTGLELICIDWFEGIEPFCGIGQLDTEQMASLYPRREAVTQKQLDLARAGWTAFRSPDPNDLVSFMAGDLTPLPFLYAALARHLEEYPRFRDGLTQTERQILTLVSKDVSAPDRIFVANMELENVFYIGDWPTFSIIEQLCTAKSPLLHCEPNGIFLYRHSDIPREDFRAQRLRLTETGEQVLAGERSVFDLIERDCCLGGVHLRSDHPMWTWDDKNKCLKIREP